MIRYDNKAMRKITPIYFFRLFMNILQIILPSSIYRECHKKMLGKLIIMLIQVVHEDILNIFST